MAREVRAASEPIERSIDGIKLLEPPFDGGPFFQDANDFSRHRPLLASCGISVKNALHAALRVLNERPGSADMSALAPHGAARIAEVGNHVCKEQQNCDKSMQSFAQELDNLRSMDFAPPADVRDSRESVSQTVSTQKKAASRREAVTAFPASVAAVVPTRDQHMEMERVARLIKNSVDVPGSRYKATYDPDHKASRGYWLCPSGGDTFYSRFNDPGRDCVADERPTYVTGPKDNGWRSPFGREKIEEVKKISSEAIGKALLSLPGEGDDLFGVPEVWLSADRAREAKEPQEAIKRFFQPLSSSPAPYVGAIGGALAGVGVSAIIGQVGKNAAEKALDAAKREKGKAVIEHFLESNHHEAVVDRILESPPQSALVMEGLHHGPGPGLSKDQLQKILQADAELGAATRAKNVATHKLEKAAARLAAKKVLGKVLTTALAVTGGTAGLFLELTLSSGDVE